MDEREYRREQFRSRFASGQIVRVERRAEHGERNWPYCWDSSMDDWIGKECAIQEVNKRGIWLSPPGGGDAHRTFPWFVLTPLTDPFYGWRFEPYANVLARDLEDNPWELDVYLWYGVGEKYPCKCARDDWLFVIPYAGNEYLYSALPGSHGSTADPGELDGKEVSIMKAELRGQQRSLAWNLRNRKDANGNALSALAPFTQVLVRMTDADAWQPDIFMHYDAQAEYDHWRYQCFRDAWAECIPYAGNEQLAGTK